jgi:selenocysteine lyase/cysteine desulfurase
MDSDLQGELAETASRGEDQATKMRRLRAEFPVLTHQAYLNAGTDGPLPTRAVRAAGAELQWQADHGRFAEHIMRRGMHAGALTDGYAALLGADGDRVALTTCTSEGMMVVVAGLDLRPGDEIVTSDEEHPGLLGALQVARELWGVSVRMVPLAEIAEAVGTRTRLVACCHVGWMTGSLAPAELGALDVPVVLDGAQAVGAIHVDVGELRCAAYAGSGQKWLCGPDGIGMLYVSPELQERLAVTRRSYVTFVDPDSGLDAKLHASGRRYSAPALPAELLSCARAALEVLEEAGWAAIHERARSLAAQLAELLRERGRVVAPRDATTLVAFHSPDPDAELEQLAGNGVIVRSIPGRPWLRASVGAWNNEDDLQQLLTALT